MTDDDAVTISPIGPATSSPTRPPGNLPFFGRTRLCRPFFPMKLNRLLLVLFLTLSSALVSRAALRLPAIIGDHMVLQQQQADPVWGWDTPGTRVTVTFAGQTHTAIAGPGDGRWTVKLSPLPANAVPQTLTIVGSSTRSIQDVLVGEVWMCSGQSNMGFQLERDWNGDIEAAASRLPGLRLISVPQVGTQELQSDFKGAWEASTPAAALKFSAVGFLFGRYVHEILGIPVGLIDNAWGGSAAEAWVRRSSLEQDPRFAALMARTVEKEKWSVTPAARAGHEQAMAKWQVLADQAKAAGRTPARAPRDPVDWMTGNSRPGNIFNGVLQPTLGYGLKGVIWYQGEANASRAWEYRDLFPFMIEQWRQEWGQGDFPFYWVQLADFMAEAPKPGDSGWAELREAQTMTQKLPRTGQAVIIDLGEGKDIHPRNKHDVAARLVRWALVKDYGMKLAYRSPEVAGVAFTGNKAVATFNCFGSSLRPFDVAEVRGFALCGADQVWHWAEGKIIGDDRVEVSSEMVSAPIAVRYAWANNPVCNLFSMEGLPVTPFRTDDFTMTTGPEIDQTKIRAKP